MNNATRKTAFVRTLDYFRTADLDEANALFNTAGQILGERTMTTLPEPTRRGRPKGSKNRAKFNSHSAIGGISGAETAIGATA